MSSPLKIGSIVKIQLVTNHPFNWNSYEKYNGFIGVIISTPDINDKYDLSQMYTIIFTDGTKMKFHGYELELIE